MKHLLTRSILCSAVLAGLTLFAAGSALAQGSNLFWDDCSAGAALTDKTDLCNSNAGAPKKLIVTFNPGASTVADVNGVDGVIDVLVDDTALPDYWRLDAAGCRSGRLSSDVNVGNSSAPFTCLEAWSQVGNAAGGATFLIEPALQSIVPGPNRGRIRFQVGVPGTVAFDPNDANEFYITAINITNQNTTTCTGCATPACLVLNLLRLTKPAGTTGGDLFVTTPDIGYSVTWQGGGTIVCPGAVPTQNRTWGQVKHLYR